MNLTNCEQESSITQQFNIQVIIPYAIALESYSLVLYRLGIQAKITFSEEIRDSAVN